jgi:membrane protease YdiL (CAAX protease family)
MTDASPPATITANTEPSSLRARVVRLFVLVGTALGIFWLAGKAGDLAWRTFPEALRAADAGGFPYVVTWLMVGLLGLAVAPAAFRVSWLSRGRPGWKAGLAVWTLVLGGTALLYQHALVAMFKNGVRIPPLGLGLIAAVIAWPVAEEWLFRGLLWRELCSGHENDRWALVAVAVSVTSVAFGLWHLPHSSSPVWVHALFGALMALLRWRTGGIMACVVVHGAGNALGYFARW